MMARRLAEARVAAMTLTRVPAGRVDGPLPRIGAGAWAFPLCGAALGAAGWAIYTGAAFFGVTQFPSALLAILGVVALTGALHEDGLADVADGFGGGSGRAQKLEIMRDSRIGTYGVIALLALMGVRVAAIPTVAEGDALLWSFVAVLAVSRAAIVVVLQVQAPARDDGMGRLAGRPGGPRVAIAVALAAASALPLGAAGIVVVLVMAGVAAGVAALARRQVGGYTGDVLGAVQAVSEAAGWIALTAALAHGL